MKIHHNVHGWIDGTPTEGEVYLEAHGGVLIDGKLSGYGSHTSVFKTVNQDKIKAKTERQWRDGELERTDKFVVIPDSPKDYLSYRTALRDYPSQQDFPNGERPKE